SFNASQPRYVRAECGTIGEVSLYINGIEQGVNVKQFLFKLLVALACCVGASSAQTVWSIGYYTPFGPGYPVLADLEWGGLTHVAMAGGAPQSDGSVKIGRASYRERV